MQKELLSAYMDGEEVSAELTEQLCQDNDSQKSWAVYHTVRSVMRKESPVLLGADFTAKMADLIELEEVKHVEITVFNQHQKKQTAYHSCKIKSILCTNDTNCRGCGVCLVAVVGVTIVQCKKHLGLHLKIQFYKPLTI